MRDEGAKENRYVLQFLSCVACPGTPKPRNPFFVESGRRCEGSQWEDKSVNVGQSHKK